MNILVLDDDEDRIKKFRSALIGHNLTIAKTSAFAIEELIACYADCYNFDIAFLDHDLKGVPYEQSGPETGFEVAEWISQNPKYKPNLIIIHTLNIEGAKEMLRVLDNQALYFPFIWEYL